MNLTFEPPWPRTDRSSANLSEDMQMEQFFGIYEYRLGDAVYRFEAGSERQARTMLPIAQAHLSEVLGTSVLASAIQGPEHMVPCVSTAGGGYRAAPVGPETIHRAA